MAPSKDKDVKRKSPAKSLAIGAIVLGGAFLGYRYLKRKSSSTSTTTAIASSTANADNTIVVPAASNAQGNYGVSSNSSYMQALAAEANLSSQLAALEKKSTSKT